MLNYFYPQLLFPLSEPMGAMGLVEQ